MFDQLISFLSALNDSEKKNFATETVNNSYWSQEKSSFLIRCQ